MQRLVFKRNFFIIASFLLLIGVMVPVATFAKQTRPRVSVNAARTSTLPQGVPALSIFPHVSSNTLCNPCGSGDLRYHNGAVQTQPKAYLIFWGASWKDSSGKLITPGQIVKKYFADVSGTNFENILTQYYMQNPDNSQTYIPNSLQFDSTHVWIDTSSITPTDNNCVITTIEDTTIQGEISKAIANKGWPSNDYNTTYFVYTPSGYAIRDNNQCSSSLFNGDCGYHTWTSTFVYAAIPYPNPLCPVPNSPNGNSDGDSLANTSSHEQFEAMTDPTPGATNGGNPFDGWYDSTGYAGEIGDKCAGNFMAGTTKLRNGGVFELQEEYSDATSSCVNTFTPHLTVNTTADYSAPCAIAAYSLRCAIIQVNNDGSGKPIWFNIPSSDSGCTPTTINGKQVSVCTITPTSGIPFLTASHTIINGYSQLGAQKNTLPLGKGDNAIITIRIDGSNGAGGLVITGNASGDILTGLEVTNFNPYGILVFTNTTTNNTISGNFVGTDGINALGNGTGVYIATCANDNIVGGETPAAANLISGNSGQGVVIGCGSGNTIEGNYIGTDFTSKAALHTNKGLHIPNPLSSSGIPNGTGIAVFANASDNMIGGIIPAAANIIAHNIYGITSEGSSNTNIIGNTISSNVIGIQVDNGEIGDSISRNIIKKNIDGGISVGNSSTDSTHVFMLENSIFANGGLGIDLYPVDTVNCSGPTPGAPNDYTPCPVILAASTTQVSGTACAGCLVEVYMATNERNDQGHGEGKTFISSVTADSSGNWSVSVTLSSGQQVTATATAPSTPGPEETSEFAANITVP